MTLLAKLDLKIRSLWFGLTLPGVAIKLILSKPRLILWSSAPILITLLLYAVLISKTQIYITVGANHVFTLWGLNSEGWFAHFLLILIKCLLWLMSALTFTFVASLISCPFNDFLAEEAEAFLKPLLSPVKKRSFSEYVQLILIDLVRTAVATALSLFAFFLSWIPVLNLFAVLMTFLLISFQYISYPQTRRGEGFKNGISFIRNHFFACLGFGATSTFLFAIPLLSGLFIPVAVVGGTLLFAKAQNRDLS